MAINNTFLEYEEKNLKKLKIKYKNLVWCELGNQDYYGKPAKIMYEKKEVKHTSIDINGKDGSLKLDLDYIVPEELQNKFDVITNYGTTEHVNNQYQAFKNIHLMCKNDGIIIHGIPFIKNWPKHCRYYYTIDFFKKLAKLCNYEIIDLDILNKDYYVYPRNLVVCILRKKDNNDFISKINFRKIKEILDTKNIERTGDYSK